MVGEAVRVIAGAMTVGVVLTVLYLLGWGFDIALSSFVGGEGRSKRTPGPCNFWDYEAMGAVVLGLGVIAWPIGFFFWSVGSYVLNGLNALNIFR